LYGSHSVSKPTTPNVLDGTIHLGSLFWGNKEMHNVFIELFLSLELSVFAPITGSIFPSVYQLVYPIWSLTFFIFFGKESVKQTI
jgi:hypothetical protein